MARPQRRQRAVDKSSFRRRASGASEQDLRASKVSNKEGHAQHQRDADNDDEDKESAHPYSSMR
jgi:hypothetical protein